MLKEMECITVRESEFVRESFKFETIAVETEGAISEHYSPK